jgi:SAM-dependent methyltransferase
MIDYDHCRNCHSLEGAAATLSAAFSNKIPGSLLDVGCGAGMWLRAAADLGIADVFGVDGIIVKDELLRFPKYKIRQIDLIAPFDLGRRFEVAICLEVAEHLPESAVESLISSIVAHSDVVLFSAACPSQPGQHHVNCQWPAYWQKLFNRHGFTCEDSVRWHVWEDQRIEPWYRQNIFWARRDPHKAGEEVRLRPVIHPDLFELLSRARVAEGVAEGVAEAIDKELDMVAKGSKAWAWYVSAASRKLSRNVTRVLKMTNAVLAGTRT